MSVNDLQFHDLNDKSGAVQVNPGDHLRSSDVR